MAKPSDAGDPFADDLTSDYAKKIIVQAKVAEMKTMMKPEVSPCDDFYTHACGNWHRHNPAQLLGDVMTDNFKLISKGFDRRLQRLLRANDLQSELEKKMQRFYMSCNLVHRDDLHYKLALENVIREYGTLPALVGAQWNSSDFSWWRTVAQIQHKYGKQIIIGLEIMHDIRNTSVNRVYISQPDFKTINTRLTNLMEEVRTSMDLQQYFGLSPSVAKHTAEQLTELERTFSSGGSGAATLQESLSLYTVADLQEKYSDHLNFTEFLGLILGEENIPKSLYIYDEEYLDKALLTMRSTPLTTQANYILWKLLEDFLVDAQPKDMVKWCTESTKKYFGKLAEHAVYKRYRNPDVESEVHKIWDQIKGIFKQRLLGDKLDWISNATRTLAIEKLERMQLNINSYDEENFENVYEEVSIDRLNYVSNVQQLLIAKGIRFVARINYDSRGNLNDNWSTQTKVGFELVKNCLADQFSGMRYGNLRLRRLKSQAESIADNVGIRIAQSAYWKWLDQVEMEETESLPHMTQSPEQLFFLSAAQFMCSDIYPERRANFVRNNFHPPYEARVFAMMINSPAFAEAFQCSNSSKMNPPNKCLMY